MSSTSELLSTLLDIRDKCVEKKVIIRNKGPKELERLIIESLKEKINKISLFSIRRKTEIKYSKLGDKAGVLGAASYVLSKYFE